MNFSLWRAAANVYNVAKIVENDVFRWIAQAWGTPVRGPSVEWVRSTLDQSALTRPARAGCMNTQFSFHLSSITDKLVFSKTRSTWRGLPHARHPQLKPRFSGSVAQPLPEALPSRRKGVSAWCKEKLERCQRKAVRLY